MNRRRLTRHIRARTGGTLGGCVGRARVARAQDALLQVAQGIEWVVSLSGFPDAHSLRKAFRRELGMTRIQWLSRQRLGPAAAVSQMSELGSNRCVSWPFERLAGPST